MSDLFGQTESGIPPEPVFSLFSGGKDSFATAKFLSERKLLLGCILIDTGVSVPGWRESCVELCRQHDWRYEVIPTTYRYEWFVWKYGFPGPGMHGEVMTYLKGRAIREYRKVHREALASGVREQESGRRTLSTKPLSQWEEVPIYAPIFEWSTADTWAYAKAAGYERPEAYSKLNISGDCLCGAFAEPHERQAIKVHYPAFDAKLCQLEIQCPKGAPYNQWGHGQGKPKPMDANQAALCFDCGRIPLTPRPVGEACE